MQKFKRSVCSAPLLLLVIVFGNFGCQDHSIVSTPIQIHTLPMIKEYGSATFRVDIGEKSKTLNLITDEYIFYRAYAILSDGQVIYGEILSKDGKESD